MANPDDPSDDGFDAGGLHPSIEFLLGFESAEPDNGDTFDVDDLARQLGVSVQTLRFFEERGLVVLEVTEAGPVYARRDRRRLRVALVAKILGFTTEEAIRIARSYD